MYPIKGKLVAGGYGAGVGSGAGVGAGGASLKPHYKNLMLLKVVEPASQLAAGVGQEVVDSKSAPCLSRLSQVENT